MKIKTRFFEEEAGGGAGGGGGQNFTPSFDGALKPDGAFSDGWTAKAFGPDYKGPLSTAKTFGDVNKMLTDAMTAARAKTDGMVKIPGEKATPEEIAAFHKALGVPEKPEEYGHKLPEGLDEKAVDAAKIGAWKARFKEMGIPKAAAEKLIGDYLADEMNLTKSAAEKQKAEAAAFVEAEKKELAARFPKIDETVSAVKALANRQGVPESLKKAITDGGFDPTSDNFRGVEALELMAWAAKATGEDRGGGGPGVGGAAVTLAQAKDIMNNKDNPKFAKYHAGDAATVAEVTAAYKMAGQ